MNHSDLYAYQALLLKNKAKNAYKSRLNSPVYMHCRPNQTSNDSNGDTELFAPAYSVTRLIHPDVTYPTEQSPVQATS